METQESHSNTATEDSHDEIAAEDSPSQVTTESSTGLDSNVAGALAYLLGPITGILFFVIEDSDQFVRFHAAQSIVLAVIGIVFWVSVSVFVTVFGFIPVLGLLVAVLFGLMSLLLAPVFLIFWLFLMYKAYQGEKYQIPVVGSLAKKTLLS